MNEFFEQLYGVTIPRNGGGQVEVESWQRDFHNEILPLSYYWRGKEEFIFFNDYLRFGSVPTKAAFFDWIKFLDSILTSDNLNKR